LLLASAGASDAEPLDFAHDIVPILRQRCGQCHTGDKKKGSFSLNTRADALAGGESGPSVVPGKSDQSELIRRVLSRDKDEQMPPDGERLSDKEVATLKRWIDGGLAWQEGLAFSGSAYEPPLRPVRVELPPPTAGRDHPIDRLVDAYLANHKIDRPSPVSDAQFVRRLSLDLLGLLPWPEQVERFLADQRPDKRDRLVRELLADDVAYADHWLSFWNDLLRNDYTGTGFITGGRKQITGWLYRSLAQNKPYDQLVRELISPSPESEGFIQGIRWRGTVSASQSQEVQFAQNISQAFLGINMKCASCHDSFIDHWKLSDAYGLAAVYSTLPLAIHRCDKPTGATAKAAWLFPELGQINANAPQPERLQQLASLLTHPDNGRFTRTIVNRLWQRLLGRGIVHPLDAMHTEPWSADLLNFLAVDFAEHGYDLKHMLAFICTSDIYQAVTPAVKNEPDGSEYLFRGPHARRMTAEQFVDAVWQLTGAAPARPDAQVVRTNIKAQGEAAAAPALQAAWIWSSDEASAAPGGQSITFRKQFKLQGAPIRAVAVITCDDEYRLLVNGREVAADNNWETVEALSLDAQLAQGANEILIVAKNAGTDPSPAGLIFETLIKFADGEPEAIGTSGDWQWTTVQPNSRGKFAEPPDDWRPAVEIQPIAAWNNRVGEVLPRLLHQSAAGPLRMVRASLVKSDALMRSLGRPNRDQIVTMRPSELTTLEAIDLANGATLADTIATGAKRLLPAGGQASDDVVKQLYVAALSRPPSAGELAAAIEMLGPQPTSESVQDLLWAVIMLPEFQLVR
jgi:hypothetical protein